MQLMQIDKDGICDRLQNHKYINILLLLKDQKLIQYL